MKKFTICLKNVYILTNMNLTMIYSLRNLMNLWLYCKNKVRMAKTLLHTHQESASEALESTITMHLENCKMMMMKHILIFLWTQECLYLDKGSLLTFNLQDQSKIKMEIQLVLDLNMFLVCLEDQVYQMRIKMHSQSMENFTNCIQWIWLKDLSLTKKTK